MMRFFLLHKGDLHVLSSYDFIKFSRLYVYVTFRRLENLTFTTFSNYMFINKYFFGYETFFTRYSALYTFGKTYHNVTVYFVMTRRKVYFPVNFFICDIQSQVSPRSLDVDVAQGFCLLSLYDMTFFTEWQIDLGLYYVKNFLHFKLFFKGNIVDSEMLTSALKIYT